MGSRVRRAFWWSLAGLLVAIAVTSAMDGTGLAVFSALPLFPLLVLFWYLGRFTRVEVGFVWGRRPHYVPAILYPLLVLGAAALIAAISGVIDLQGVDWQKAGLNLVLMSITTIPMVVLTEEGFFRGWLWASLGRAGQSDVQKLAWSSIGFSLWHWSTVSLDTGFGLPLTQIPVYLINVAVIGAVWGMLRLISGSVVVASVSHGLWNGIAYSLFGFGPLGGALGIENTMIYGPEVGVVGLVLNLLFAIALWRWWQRRARKHRG